MRNLTVTLSDSDRTNLISRSIALQQFFQNCGHHFKINFQNGHFSQFLVNIDQDVESFRRLLESNKFEATVSEPELELEEE